MHFEEAVKRINNIDCEKINTLEPEKEGLGAEFLRRLALFFEKNENNEEIFFYRKSTPAYLSIARILGYKEEIELGDYCDKNICDNIENDSVITMLEFYLQLAKYADENENVAKYLSIYEPMIKMIEKGGSFMYRDGGMYVKNTVFVPLRGWYEKFLKQAKDMQHDN